MKLYLLFLLLFSNLLFSQSNFKGYLLDKENNVPLSGANIFIPNTAIATISDANGFFEIPVSNSTTVILISFVGYETISVNIKAVVNFAIARDFFLTKSNVNLTEVVVNFKTVKNRKEALNIFKKFFIGESEIASKVLIQNPHDLDFREEKSADHYRLIALTDKPIVLINEKLGYKISYILLDFEYNLQDKKSTIYSSYKGYAQFTDIIKEYNLNEKKVKYNRENAFYGSAMHLVRSIYNRDYENNAFAISKFRKEPQNENKKYKNYADSIHNKIVGVQYKILKAKVNADEIVETDQNQKKYLIFTDFLNVIYKDEKEDFKYVTNGRHRNNYQSTEIELKDTKIEIFSDGNYFPDDKMVFYGHMAFEKMGDMLPFDYQP